MIAPATNATPRWFDWTAPVSPVRSTGGYLVRTVVKRDKACFVYRAVFSQNENRVIASGIPPLRVPAVVSAGMDPLIEEHVAFIREMATCGLPPPISRETADRALAAWTALCTATELMLPVPCASVGPDGEVLYSWDRDQHHFEVEIIPDQDAIEYFYRDRSTGMFWEQDLSDGDGLTPGIVETLKFFL